MSFVLAPTDRRARHLSCAGVAVAAIDLAARFQVLLSLECDYRPPGARTDNSVNVPYVEAFLTQKPLRL